MQNWVEMAQAILVRLRDTPEVFDSGIYDTKVHKIDQIREPEASRAFNVVVRNVDYAHRGKTTPTISNLSFEIAAGSTTAIVGPSGAGKTTLVDIMLGLYEPQSGSVTIDGLSTSELRRKFPGMIAYVPQRPGLVSGSIAENVALGFDTHEIDEHRVWDALKKAELDLVVKDLPNGIHSSLGAHSDGLSGGQIQRLGLARALYTNPRLIVLDEATSALDATTEASITESIRSLGSETTVVVIAHRLSTIQHSDVVHVMDGGKIIASGTFSEVRKQVPMVEEYVKLMSFDD
jgi:ATP-binding cassette subfamily C protein